jgi:dCTP diphosphatase
MQDTNTTLDTLKKEFKKFIDERDWNQFHSPKNMSMGLAIEASEFMEFFLWSDTQESFKIFEQKREAIEQEIADIAIFIFMICEENNVDLASAMRKKMVLNAQKYPVEKAKGKSTKYTEL